MTNILIVDDQPLCRDLLAALLKAKGFTCVTSNSRQEAQQAIQRQSPDLIVTELVLGGSNGFEFIQGVKKATSTRNVPVVVLTSSNDKAHIVRAAALGIHGYLLKSQFSAERFLTRVLELVEVAVPAAQQEMERADATKNHVAAHNKTPSQNADRPVACPVGVAQTVVPRSPIDSGMHVPKLLTREQTIQRLDEVAAGKTIAGVVAQVIALANSPDADLSDMVKALESDPVLATRVIHSANSASTGTRTRIQTVEDAVRTLGVREIRNLAFNIGIFGAFPPSEADGFNSLGCWQHSFAVANLIGLMDQERDHYQICVNHLAGLCHDLGEILLRQYFAVEFSQILAFAQAHGLSVYEVENIALGIRHPELLSRLLSRIGLPQPVVHTIREFYERQIKGQAGGMSNAVRVLALANQMAHGMLLAPSTLAKIGPISRIEWRALGTDKPPPAVDPVAKRNEILSATNLLARLPVKDEKELLAPLLARQDKRIWYLRPESFVDLDPLGMALSLISQLTVSANPPTPEQWSEIEGLVVVGSRAGSPPIIPSELAQLRTESGQPDMPILILAGQEATISCVNGMTIRPYPLSLAELSEWLSGVAVRPMAEAV